MAALSCLPEGFRGFGIRRRPVDGNILERTLVEIGEHPALRRALSPQPNAVAEWPEHSIKQTTGSANAIET